MKESERKLLLGIMCLVLVVMGGTYAVRSIHEGIYPRTTIQGSKGEDNVTVEERSYFFHGRKVYGKIYFPDDTTRRHPLLVYCHGLGQTGDESKNICTNAARIGYVAYSLDFRGGGRDSRSDGDVYRMSARTEVKDLGHVLGRLMKEDFVDKDRVYLCGHSLGALVASLYACKEPKEIAGAILIAPAYNLPDMAKEKYPDPDDIERKTELLSYPVGDVFFQDIYDMNPYRKARKYKVVQLLAVDVIQAQIFLLRVELLERFDGILEDVARGRRFELERIVGIAARGGQTARFKGMERIADQIPALLFDGAVQPLAEHTVGIEQRKVLIIELFIQ